MIFHLISWGLLLLSIVLGLILVVVESWGSFELIHYILLVCIVGLFSSVLSIFVMLCDGGGGGGGGVCGRQEKRLISQDLNLARSCEKKVYKIVIFDN